MGKAARIKRDKRMFAIKDHKGLSGNHIVVEGEMPDSFVPILRQHGASDEELSLQGVREVFTKTAHTKYKNDPIAFHACILGRYAADYLVEDSPEESVYKWLYLQSQIVTLLHYHPIEGIEVSPEVKRDNMAFGESWYEEYVKNTKSDVEQVAEGDETGREN